MPDSKNLIDKGTTGAFLEERFPGGVEVGSVHIIAMSDRFSGAVSVQEFEPAAPPHFHAGIIVLAAATALRAANELDPSLELEHIERCIHAMADAILNGQVTSVSD